MQTFPDNLLNGLTLEARLAITRKLPSLWCRTIVRIRLAAPLVRSLLFGCLQLLRGTAQAADLQLRYRFRNQVTHSSIFARPWKL